MKLFLKIAIMFVMLSCLGCANVVYRHPNYTPELWAKDSYECERDARQSGYYGTGIVGASNFRQFYDRCLYARGWIKTKEPTNPPVNATRYREPTKSLTTFHMGEKIRCIIVDKKEQNGLLTLNQVYTVSVVNEFGNVQLEEIPGHWFRPQYFEK